MPRAAEREAAEGGVPAGAGEALFLETECSPGPRELRPPRSVPLAEGPGEECLPGSGRDKAVLSSSSGKDGGAPGRSLIGRPNSTPPAPCIQWVRGCGMPSTDAGPGTVDRRDGGKDTCRHGGLSPLGFGFLVLVQGIHGTRWRCLI